MEYCRCCVKDVSDQAEKKQRRLLSSATMQTTLQTLKISSANCKLTRNWMTLKMGLFADHV